MNYLIADTTYGLNAALLTGVALAYPHGWGQVFGMWQTYGVLVGGTVSFVLLQQALQAGDLIAAQPGITLINPLIALVWASPCSANTPRAVRGWPAPPSEPWPWPPAPSC